VLAACGGDQAGSAAGDNASAVVLAQDTTPPTTPPPPPNPRDDAPPQIRGLYLNAYAAGSPTRLPKLVGIADETEINTFVVDVKSERGVHFKTDVPLAKELTQQGEVTIRDLKAFADTLKAHGIYSIARIVVFKDPVLSKAKPEWSVKNPSGGLWKDKKGNTWVSPWDKSVWDYNISIAEEVARAGFDEIQFDYVRFAEPYKSLPNQVHPRAQGDRTDAIAAFLNEAKRRLHPLGVTVTADVFGLSPNTSDDVSIGQQWETIASTADHILPMMYPSHYLPSHLPGVARPNKMPYETLYKSAGMARVRNDKLREVGVKPARIIPWLQAFSAPWLRDGYDYGPQQIRDQTRAVYDVGLDDWVLWHPGSKYEPYLAALEKTTASHAKQGYTPPADVAAVLARFEREGIAEKRQNASEQARGQTADPAAAAAAKTGKEEPEAAPGAAGGTR
jgi:hypothetical protein